MEYELGETLGLALCLEYLGWGPCGSSAVIEERGCSAGQAR
jgi:hypothetical protein